MNEDELNRLTELCDQIDQFINAKMRPLLEDDDKHLAVNAMINVATTTLSKVMLLVREEMRDAVMHTAAKITKNKTQEGDALIQSVKTILHARGIGDTCQPIPPTKH